MTKKEEYNEVPVEICGGCGSLNLINVNQGVICDDCGTLNYTRELTIDEYLHEKKDKNPAS